MIIRTEKCICDKCKKECDCYGHYKLKIENAPACDLCYDCTAELQNWLGIDSVLYSKEDIDTIQSGNNEDFLKVFRKTADIRNRRNNRGEN